MSGDLMHALLALAAVVVPLLLAWKLLTWQLRERNGRPKPPRRHTPPPD
jgi:hypothetical protein